MNEEIIINKKSKIIAGLFYLSIISDIWALVVLLFSLIIKTKKPTGFEFLFFHAKQAFATKIISYLLIFIGVAIWFPQPLGDELNLLIFLLMLPLIILSLVAMFKAFKGKMFIMPFYGKLWVSAKEKRIIRTME